MSVYFSFYFVVVALVVLGIVYKNARATSNLIFYLVFLILILFSGLRGFSGADTIIYVKVFDSIKSNGFDHLFLQFEPFFVLFLVVISGIFESAFFLLFIYSLLQVYILYRVYKSGVNKIFFIVYVLLFYLNFHFNTIRAGLAALLLLLCLVEDNKKIRYLAMIVAPGFHVSILFFYPFFIFSYKVNHIKKYFISIIVLLFVVFLNFDAISVFIDKMYSYESYLSETKGGVSLFVIMQVSYLAFSLFLMRYASFDFKLSSVLLILFLFISLSYPVAYRMIILCQLFYFFFMLKNMNEYLVTFEKLILFWPYVLIIFFFNFNSLVNERSMLLSRADSIADDFFDSTYIPYKLYWNDELANKY